MAFSDFHLGYARADSDGFVEFIKELESRNDLAKLPSRGSNTSSGISRGVL